MDNDVKEMLETLGEQISTLENNAIDTNAQLQTMREERDEAIAEAEAVKAEAEAAAKAKDEGVDLDMKSKVQLLLSELKELNQDKANTPEKEQKVVKVLKQISIAQLQREASQTPAGGAVSKAVKDEMIELGKKADAGDLVAHRAFKALMKKHNLT